MKTILLLLLTTLTSFAQIPVMTDVRIIENDGDYGARHGIWGIRVTTNHVGQFPVNDGFLVDTAHPSQIHSNKSSGVHWRTNPNGPVSRRMGIPLNVANIGNKSLHFGNAFEVPGNYRHYGQPTPLVSNLFTVVLLETNGVQEVHRFEVDAVLPWYNRPAIPGTPHVAEFRPYWQGLAAGFATDIQEPMMWGAWIDTSAVMDGDYRMVISYRGGNSTTRLVRIDVMEVFVIGF